MMKLSTLICFCNASALTASIAHVFKVLSNNEDASLSSVPFLFLGGQGQNITSNKTKVVCTQKRGKMGGGKER